MLETTAKSLSSEVRNVECICLVAISEKLAYLLLFSLIRNIFAYSLFPPQIKFSVIIMPSFERVARLWRSEKVIQKVKMLSKKSVQTCCHPDHCVEYRSLVFQRKLSCRGPGHYVAGWRSSPLFARHPNPSLGQYLTRITSRITQ